MKGRVKEVINEIRAVGCKQQDSREWVCIVMMSVCRLGFPTICEVVKENLL